MKENLEFTLDHFDDLKGIANELLKNGSMTKGSTEDFSDFLASLQDEDDDRVVH
mgnify:FL=1